MSHVTTVMIQMHDYEKQESALKSLNNWLKDNGHLGGEFEFLDAHKSAGKNVQN